jgi:ribonuclease HI
MVVWHMVTGHSGDKPNDRMDRLASCAIASLAAS